MEDKTFWESLVEIGAGIYNNRVNQEAAVRQEAAKSASVAGVVRFGIVAVLVYFGVQLVVSFFKRR